MQRPYLQRGPQYLFFSFSLDVQFVLPSDDYTLPRDAQEFQSHNLDTSRAQYHSVILRKSWPFRIPVGRGYLPHRQR